MAYTRDTLTMFKSVGGEIGMKWWVYDTVDAVATVYAAGYISDAKVRGMEKGDIVIVRRWTTAIPATTDQKLTAAGTACVLAGVTQHVCLGMSTAGAADLTDGEAIAVTNT